MSIDQELLQAIQQNFRTFGMGRKSEFSPIANALSEQPLQFAAGVDVAEVIEFIRLFNAPPVLKSEEPGRGMALQKTQNGAEWLPVILPTID